MVPLYRYHRQRGTEHQMNLHPCTAKYHGHKLHGPERKACGLWCGLPMSVIDDFQGLFLPSRAYQ